MAPAMVLMKAVMMGCLLAGLICRAPESRWLPDPIQPGGTTISCSRIINPSESYQVGPGLAGRGCLRLVRVVWNRPWPLSNNPAAPTPVLIYNPFTADI